MDVRNCEICVKSFLPKGWKQYRCDEHKGMEKRNCLTCGVEMVIFPCVTLATVLCTSWYAENAKDPSETR